MVAVHDNFVQAHGKAPWHRSGGSGYHEAEGRVRALVDLERRLLAWPALGVKVKVEALDPVSHHVNRLPRRPGIAHAHGEIFDEPLEGRAAACRTPRAPAPPAQPGKSL